MAIYYYYSHSHCYFVHVFPLSSGKPFTGRMHQIRVHLQWLGHPIIDDPIYNSPVWGQTCGKGGVTDNDALKVRP